MTKEEALKVLMKMRAWRNWGKEQNEEERPEMPEQKEVDEAFDVCIEMLSILSLPSDLDEAAENRVTENGRFKITSFEKMRIDDIMFGAEWMVEQGYSQEEIVEDKSIEVGYGVIPGISPIINLPDSFKPGDKVIVQIRKKQ